MCQSAWSMTKPATVGPMAGVEGDDQAEDAHGRTAAINREHQHKHGHGHRHEDAGAGGLHQTAAQKHRKVEAHGRQQRAHGKQAH